MKLEKWVKHKMKKGCSKIRKKVQSSADIASKIRKNVTPPSQDFYFPNHEQISLAKFAKRWTHKQISLANFAKKKQS